MKNTIRAVLIVLVKAFILALVVGGIIGMASLFIEFSLETVFLGAGFVLICIGGLTMSGGISSRADMTYLHARSASSSKTYENATENIRRFEDGSVFSITLGLAGVLLIVISTLIG